MFDQNFIDNQLVILTKQTLNIFLKPEKRATENVKSFNEKLRNKWRN